MEKSIQALVDGIKKEMFSSVDLHCFVLASAYDTAWLAMIPDPENPSRPMFPQCLEWVCYNQQESGYWGEQNHSNLPTVECLPATLACMIALKTWHVGHDNVKKGLGFIHVNTEKLLLEQRSGNNRSFSILFAGMLECGWSKGLEIFAGGMPESFKSIFAARKAVLEMVKSSDHPYHHPPLIYYLEALPTSCKVDCNEVLQNLSGDGSLLHSPSATARTFMVTKNKNCQRYLQSLVQRFGSGVPPIYPIDEDLIKLCIVDRLEGLGLDEHFHHEIEDLLSSVYRSRIEHDPDPTKSYMPMIQIYKESLAYRLLTMHGYRVSTSIFSLLTENMEESNEWEMDQNHDFFLSVVLNIYRASDFIFTEENEAKKVKSYTRKILENGISKEKFNVASNLQREVEHELRVPWLARLDHLEHRECIERGKTNDLWAGKASYLRLSCLNNDMLLKLARDNYTHRQSIYRSELEELKRWSRDSGMFRLGFGRDKTTYCYFALASTAYHIPMRAVRTSSTKSGILLTIINDFFDNYGTMAELTSFTDAVERWDGQGLPGIGKVLFDALDSAINDTAKEAFHVQGRDITEHLRDNWRQVIKSWLKEAEWAISCYKPSIAEYLKNASISIANQTRIPSSTYLVGPTLTEEMMRHRDCQKLNELLMLSGRLLNDMRSYEKESKEGAPNLVFLLMQSDPTSRMEEVYAYIARILDGTKQELLEHILMDDKNCVSRPCRNIYLMGLKVFHMFYNSSNGFDSATEMLQGINKAFYQQLSMQM